MTIRESNIVGAALESATAAPVLAASGKPEVAAALENPSRLDEPVLVFEQVSKWYGSVIGVNQVTLEIRPGITGLVGHNGSGKSTLMRLAAGLARAELGRVLVGGLDAWSWEAKRNVGFCPDLDVFYEEMSGRGFIQTMARLCGYTRAEAQRRTEEALKLVGMVERANLPLAGYSKGMRQRVKLAQALVHEPALLLLDEPLSGIDPVGRREMIAIFHKLARRGTCLLVSSHELDALERLTDRVAIMASGRVAAVGALTQIRDLLADHPRSIRLACDQDNLLARRLLEMDEVVGLERTPGGLGFLVSVRGREFFPKLKRVVLTRLAVFHKLNSCLNLPPGVLGFISSATAGKSWRVLDS